MDAILSQEYKDLLTKGLYGLPTKPFYGFSAVKPLPFQHTTPQVGMGIDTSNDEVDAKNAG